MENSAVYELCKLYYDEKTLAHAERVALKAKELCQFFKLPYDNWDKFVYQLGLIHDLYEDTNITQGVWFDPHLNANLKLLTKSKDDKYIDYIKRIKNNARNYKELIPAYIVKLADIWDHLNETETLTEKRKEKYLKAIPYLL